MKLNLGILLVLASGVGFSANSLNELEQKLSTKREQVEILFQEIEDQMGQFKIERSQLQARRNEIEAELQRVELEMAKSQKKLEELLAKTNTKEDQENLVVGITETLSAAEEQIKSGIPYKVNERLAFIKNTQSQLENKTETKEKIVKRLWNFLEDEYRLTKENTLSREVIKVDGEEKIADVAKLGMIFAYFQTPDLRVGTLVKNVDGSYSYAYEKDAENQKNIAKLMDALKKQIRVGEFVLPNKVIGGVL